MRKLVAGVVAVASLSVVGCGGGASPAVAENFVHDYLAAEGTPVGRHLVTCVEGSSDRLFECEAALRHGKTKVEVRASEDGDTFVVTKKDEPPSILDR